MRVLEGAKNIQPFLTISEKCERRDSMWGSSKSFTRVQCSFEVLHSIFFYISAGKTMTHFDRFL